MSLNIKIETVPHDQQRYETVGDWFMEGETLVITVSELGDWRMEALIALHEFVEVMLCKEKGITGEQVDAFDMAFEGKGEPGDAPDAPYYREHQIASIMERSLCLDLGVNWQEYDKKVMDL